MASSSAPAYFQGPPSRSSAPQEGRIQHQSHDLVEEKKRLDVHYQRWSKRRAELYSNIFKMAAVQATILLGFAVAKPLNPKPHWKPALCHVTSAAACANFFVICGIISWLVKLKFVENQLWKIKNRTAELEPAWIAFRQMGFNDAAMEDWFVDEPGWGYFHSRIVLSAYVITVVLVCSSAIAICWSLPHKCKGARSCWWIGFSIISISVMFVLLLTLVLGKDSARSQKKRDKSISIRRRL